MFGALIAIIGAFSTFHLPVMYCEQSSSAIVIDSSDSDGEYEQQSSATAAAVNVRNVSSSEADDSNVNDDINHNDSTLPRPKKSKGMHAGAALYKCKYNTIWAREFPFITAVPGDPYR